MQQRLSGDQRRNHKNEHRKPPKHQSIEIIQRKLTRANPIPSWNKP